jgi:hypothetical protein
MYNTQEMQDLYDATVAASVSLLAAVRSNDQDAVHTAWLEMDKASLAYSAAYERAYAATH